VIDIIWNEILQPQIGSFAITAQIPVIRITEFSLLPSVH